MLRRLSFWTWVWIALGVLNLSAFAFGDHDVDVAFIAVLLFFLGWYEQKIFRLEKVLSEYPQDP